MHFFISFFLIIQEKNNLKNMNTLESDLVNHFGSCHCGKIKFSVQASRKLLVYTCKYELFILNSIYI